MLGKGKQFIRYKQKNGIPDSMNLSTILEKTQNFNYLQMNILYFGDICIFMLSQENPFT